LKRFFLFFGISILFLGFNQAQEICDNGIDDDGDGFVDCYDSDCSANGYCDGFYMGNDVSCEAEPTDFPQFSLSLGHQSEDHVTNNVVSPTIGDLDRDGIPEILTVNKYEDKIYLLNGDDASIKSEVILDYPEWSGAAMANIEDDNCGEVFVINRSTGNFRINAFDCSLNALWQSEILQNDPVALGLADFDRDGQAELYYKDEIRDPLTGIRLVETSNADWNGFPGSGVAVDILGDENLELVLGNKIYSVNLGSRTQDSGVLTLLATMPVSYQPKGGSFPSGMSAMTSVADYNQDGRLDVIISGADGGNVTTVFFWDVYNNEVKTFSDPSMQANNYQFGWRRGTGRVNIGDIDGDGELNAVFVSGSFLYALDENWEPFWKDEFGDPNPVFIFDETSGITAPTLFDFNGDGKMEIVYRDENYMYIIDGDGRINISVHCRSRSHTENPIIADVDADGSTEICVTCTSETYRPGTRGEDLSLDAPAEVRVYKSAGEPWLPARKVWNQHAYFNVNINDDLTVPRTQQKHHLVWSDGVCTPGPNRPLNGFLNQSPFLSSDGCLTNPISDLAIIDSTFTIIQPTCPEQEFTVSFLYENIGDVALSGDIPVTFYNGSPLQEGSVKLATEHIALSNFSVGSKDTLTLELTGSGASFKLYAVLNDYGSTNPTPISLPNTNFLECDYSNNVDSIKVNPIPFQLTTEVTDNLYCSTDSAAANGTASAYTLVGDSAVTADYDFYWFDGDSVKESPDFTEPVYAGLAAGTYTVFAINNSVGCSSDTVQVEVVDIQRNVTIAEAGADIETCSQSYQLNANSPNDHEKGSWSVLSAPEGIAYGPIFSIDTLPSAYFNVRDSAVSGDYIIRWTITDNDSICNETFDELKFTYQRPPYTGEFNAAPKATFNIENTPEINLFDLLDNEDTVGTWIFRSSNNYFGTKPTYNEETGIVNLEAAASGSYSFAYLINGTSVCSVVDSVRVEFDFTNFDCNAMKLTGITEGASCSNTEDGSIYLLADSVSHTDSLSVVVYSDETDNYFETVKNPGNGLMIELNQQFAPGLYEVIVEDLLLGCVDTLSLNIGSKYEFTPSVLNITNEDYGNQGNGSFTMETNISGEQYEIFLNGTSYRVLSADTKVVEVGNLSSGNYSVEVQDLTFGCKASLNVQIDENLNTATDITSFVINEQLSAAVIDSIDHQIKIEVATGTDLTRLIPIIELSAGASIQPSANQSIDFTEVVDFMVTAEDGETSQVWNVEVTMKGNQSISFALPDTLYQDQSPIQLSASSSSGLPVKFAIESGNASINNNQLILNGASNLTVTAFIEGNDSLNYAETKESVEVLGIYNLSFDVLRPNDDPVEVGLAKLFSLEGGLYQRSSFTKGDLSFSGIRDGAYIIQVIPIGSSSADLFPTYYADTHFHRSATVLNINDNIDTDMYMLPKRTSPQQEVGRGNIKGKVVKAEGSNNSRMAVEDLAEGEGIRELIIYLIEKETNSIVHVDVTDSTGSFEMLEISEGDYELRLDIPGIDQSASTFDLPIESLMRELNLTIYLNNSGIVNVETDAILSNEKPVFDLSIYPNPTNGIVYVNGYQGPAQEIEVVASNGQVVKRVKLTEASNQKIDLSGLGSGIYFLQADGSKQQGRVKVVIE
jgi:hypothetical protein